MSFNIEYFDITTEYIFYKKDGYIMSFNNTSKGIHQKRNKALYFFFKRSADIIGSTIVLIGMSPILILIAILIKLESKGPVLFKQSRIGRNGEPFTIYKFRSMYIDAPIKPSNDFSDSKLHTTRVGIFLRKSSLDEIPQLFNVIKGDMSLIGPRPVLAIENDLISLRRESGVEQIHPGLTGWAQVNGRTEISNIEKAKFDFEYLEKQSIRFDMYILVKTVLLLLAGGKVKL